ncbi:MAG: hypothetical protein HOQ09_08555 [Gemmatimonadaceae bacterium]|nr:hypothetical protein [Gemmatimonadaceae bacterium]
MHERTKTMAAGTGGVLAALLGGLCCAGPVVFAALGLGAGLASRFEPLRPLFGALMVGAFAVAFRRAYGDRSAAMAPSLGGTRADAGDGASAAAGSAGCAVPRSRRREPIMLWAAAMLALALWMFPAWSKLFVDHTAAP